MYWNYAPSRIVKYTSYNVLPPCGGLHYADQSSPGAVAAILLTLTRQDMTEPAASLPNFKRFKVTDLQWATLMAAVRHLLSTKPTVTQRWYGTIRQSGKLVRELCSAFTMYAEKMIYILNQGSVTAKTGKYGPACTILP